MKRIRDILYQYGHRRPDADPWGPPGDPAAPPIAIRRAVEEDRPTLQRLSALDSAPPISGEALVAFVDGEPWAAISLADRRVVADPFRSSAQAVELLRVRASHLEADGSRGRWLARAARPRRASS